MACEDCIACRIAVLRIGDQRQRLAPRVVVENVHRLRGRDLLVTSRCRSGGRIGEVYSRCGRRFLESGRILDCLLRMVGVISGFASIAGINEVLGIEKYKEGTGGAGGGREIW